MAQYIPSGRSPNTYAALSDALKAKIPAIIASGRGTSVSVGEEELETITVPLNLEGLLTTYKAFFTIEDEGANAIGNFDLVLTSNAQIQTISPTIANNSVYIGELLYMVDPKNSNRVVTYAQIRKVGGTLEEIDAVTLFNNEMFTSEHVFSLRGQSGHAADTLHYNWSLWKFPGVP